MNANVIQFLNEIISKNDIVEDDDLITFIKIARSSLPPVMYEFGNVQREIYILFHFASHLKQDDCYYSNIYNILINHLSSAKGFFYRHIYHISREYRDKVRKYLVFNDLVALRSDVLNIFFLCMFLNTDPVYISNYQEYYYSAFKLIFFTYIKDKTEGIWGEDEAPTTLTEDDMHVSNRCKIFEDGIKLSQIYHLCHESDTLKRINVNFNEIRNKILINDFQKLYSAIIEKNLIKDNKFLILKFNVDHDIKLQKIQKELPVIYKLLRSIKVRSRNRKNFNFVDRGMIKKIIKDIVYARIESLVDAEYAEILAESISKNLENSITNGEFLDPCTLTVLHIDTNVFIVQLKSFLHIILENIQTEELNYV